MRCEVLPPLWIGVTMPCFSAWGTRPVCKDLSHRIFRGRASWFLQSSAAGCGSHPILLQHLGRICQWRAWCLQMRLSLERTGVVLPIAHWRKSRDLWPDISILIFSYECTKLKLLLISKSRMLCPLVCSSMNSFRYTVLMMANNSSACCLSSLDPPVTCIDGHVILDRLMFPVSMTSVELVGRFSSRERTFVVASLKVSTVGGGRRTREW